MDYVNCIFTVTQSQSLYDALEKGLEKSAAANREAIRSATKQEDGEPRAGVYCFC